jgi:hypothetical protein
MAKAKVVAPTTAMALAKQAAPNASKTQQRAIADNILKLNNQKKGEAFKAGETVRLGSGVKLPPPVGTPGTFMPPEPRRGWVWGTTFAAPSIHAPQTSSSPQPVPSIPKPEPTVKDTSTKSASPDIILVDQDDIPVDLILSLTLEKIGAQELITIARHDIVNGQNIIYQPIKNISDVAIAYNPQNMISFPDSSDSYFKSFVIKLESHIPQYKAGELYADTIVKDNNVFLDSASGSIIIESVGLKRDYDIEVQMLSSGKIFNDTIYDEDNL